MGYYFGKGSAAPTDSTAATPQAQVNGEPDNKTACMQKCNERYQKDLDSPSVDYATAQQRYNDCKMSCQDIPAIQEQAQSAYQSTIPQQQPGAAEAAAGAAGTAGAGAETAATTQGGNECVVACGDQYKDDINDGMPLTEAYNKYTACVAACQKGPIGCTSAQECIDKYGQGWVCDNGKCKWDVKWETGCAKKCGEELNANLEAGMHYPAAIKIWSACIAKCDDPNKNRCKNGYESNTKVDGVFPDCKKDFEPRTMPNGHRWCCPSKGDIPEDCVDFIEGQECEPGYEIKMYNGVRYCCPSGDPEPCDDETNPCTPPQVCVDGVCKDPAGEGCEGGHILDDRYAGGAGGRALTEKELDGVIPAAAGWTRNGAWGEHIIYHPDYGFRSIIDTYAFYKGGEAGWSGTINWACEKGKERTVIGEEDWCCPIEGGGQAGQQQLGEYQWPAELQELYDLLMGRGKEFMGMETGYTDEAIRAMFGRDFENIRDIGARTAETGMQSLQREGLMGTGASQDLVGDAAWGTEQGISNLMRDLLVADEDKKKQDLLDYTGAAQSIFGGGMGYNSLLEQINAGRRGEAQDSLAMMLQYFMSLMSSWGA